MSEDGWKKLDKDICEKVAEKLDMSYVEVITLYGMGDKDVMAAYDKIENEA